MRALSTAGRPGRNEAIALLERRITGRPEYVAETVAKLRQCGRLVQMTRPYVNDAGQAVVIVRILPLLPAQASRRRRWKADRRLLAFVSIGVAVAAVVVYLVIQLVQAVAALLTAAAPVLIGVAVLALLLRLVTGHQATCVGLHCPGCRH
jgi:hypothetical protein